MPKNYEITMDEVFEATAEELQKKIGAYFKSIKKPFVQTDGFLYSQGSIPIMLVAHMDTVHRYTPTICKSANGKIWMAPEGIGGDDRCGIWIILQILKKHDVHILFTQGEETGCIGAHDFTQCGIYPEVNFIVEIDRKGSDDAVFYDCGNEEFKSFIIETTGFVESYGSFSDISVIAPHLDRAAVNLSSGYYNPHTSYEFIHLDDMEITRISVEDLIEEMDWGKVYTFKEKIKSYAKYNNYGSGIKYASAYKSYDDKKYWEHGWEDDYLTYKPTKTENMSNIVPLATEEEEEEDFTPTAASEVPFEEDNSVTMPDEKYSSYTWEDIYSEQHEMVRDEVKFMLQTIIETSPPETLVDDVSDHVYLSLCDHGYM